MNLIDELVKDGKEGFIVLEPRSTYDKGVLSYKEDTNQIVYGYDELAEALAAEYIANGFEEEESYDMAIEWLDYNTVRSLDYMGDTKPIMKYTDHEE